MALCYYRESQILPVISGLSSLNLLFYSYHIVAQYMAIPNILIDKIIIIVI